MDEIFKATPLDTVQFISIFSYLNTLSDFLFIENYLAEDDQTKQIPIVNGLYQYFEDHRNNQSMQLKLIRSLLKGSDLYGEEDNENLDVVFVNAMFDHIISSLVFDKYGNVYGFIAHVVHKADNFQIDSICEQIKSALQNATFGNEYGDPSTLTSTAADRIFSDIILPLFPQPKKNLSLFSLDYIYAQAGSIILRSGRINTTYYTDTKTYNVTVLDEEHLFDEYLIIGQILDYLLVTTNRDRLIIKAFALPAVCYYVFWHKFFLSNENVRYIVTDQILFNEAFEYLVTYMDVTFESIYNKLKEDCAYKMHLVFSKFYTAVIHNIYLNVGCSKFIEVFEESRHDCKLLAKWYDRTINEIGETYQEYDLKAVQDSFGESLMKSLTDSQVVMNWIVPDDDVENIFNTPKQLSYDLLEFYFPLNNTIEYYALMRENYTVTLIKEADNFTLFKKKLGSSFDELIAHGFPKILKFANQSMDVCLENLVEYKKKRLQSYLKIFGEKQSSNVKWWTEFGLSLIPAYQNFSNSNLKNYYTTEIHDEINIILLLDKFGEGISSQLTQEDTRSFLTSKGTTFRSVHVRVLSNRISEGVIKQEDWRSEQIKIEMIEILEELCFHNEVPGFNVTILTEEYITILKPIIDALEEMMINNSFISVKNMLHNIEKLKVKVSNNSYRTAGSLKNEKSQLFVKTQDTTSDIGYGYKFIYSSSGRKAQLRTSYELKEKIIVSILGITEASVKMYIIINNVTLVQENNFVFEINNQLRKNDTRLLFSEIPILPGTDDQCKADEHLTGPMIIIDCPRRKRQENKDHQETKAVNLALNLDLHLLANLSEHQIRRTIQKYVFPDDSGLESTFVEDWINDTNLEVPKWSENYRIDNHELLLHLRYAIHLDGPNLSEFDCKYRIEYIYNKKERRTIEKGSSIDGIVKDYNDQKAQYSVTFEDYYAIRNFATTGFTRITGDTNEAMYMKIALYKLAIRQSDDPDGEFYLRLFKVEAKPIEIVYSTLFNIGRTFNLTKFTLTSVSRFSAIKLATMAAPGYKNILYEMKFSKPYLRAQIEQIYYSSDLKAILLPGSEFEITMVTEMQIKGLGGCLKVELQFIHKTEYEKYAWYKKIMNEN